MVDMQKTADYCHNYDYSNSKKVCYLPLFNITCEPNTQNKLYVTRSEKSRLPRTQQQDTLFTIKQYTLTNNSARY